MLIPWGFKKMVDHVVTNLCRWLSMGSISKWLSMGKALRTFVLHTGGVGTMGHTPTPSHFGATFRGGGSRRKEPGPGDPPPPRGLTSLLEGFIKQTMGINADCAVPHPSAIPQNDWS